MKMTWLAAVGVLLAPCGALAQETAPPAEIRAVPAEATTAAPGQATPTEIAEASAPTLPLGAWVQLEIVDALTSDTATIGQSVELRVAEPVMVDGVVVIPAGTSGVGEIIDVQEAAMAGMPGLLVVASRHLDLNGQQVDLEGMIVGASGRAFSTGVAVAFIGPGAAFIRGREFAVAAGTRTQARLAGGAPEVAAPVTGVNTAPSPSPGKAMVVFFRPTQNTGWPYTYGVAENGVTLTRLRNGSYQAVEVDPGRHEFALLAPFTNGQPSADTLNVELAEGEMLFIRHSIAFLAPSTQEAFLERRMRQVTAADAED